MHMSTLLPLVWRRLWYRRHVENRIVKQFLNAQLPALKRSCHDITWLAVDLETTSLNPAQGEIASIGWVPIMRGAVVLKHAERHFITIKDSVGQSAIYHHIRDSELDRALPIRSAMERFFAVATGSVLVCHNASLDMGFLNRVSLELFDTPVLAPVVDTLLLEERRLQRRHKPAAPDGLRLHSCRRRYGLPDYPVHDALTDALATAELLLAFLAHYDSRGKAVLGDCL